MLFKGSIDEPRVVWDQTVQFSQDFRIHNFYLPTMISKQTQQLKWSKPLSGFLKINFDAAWMDNKAGMAFITRDEEGFVHGGGVFFNSTVASAVWAEVDCFSWCLTWANNKGWVNIYFERDCSSIINRVNSSREDITALGFMIRQCGQFLLSLNNCEVVWCNRICNKVANSLSRLGLQNCYDFFFDLDFSSEVQNLVIKDSIE